MTRLHVLATGGTIDKVYDLAGSLVIGPPAAPALLAPVLTDLDVTVDPVLAIDSLEMTDDDRRTVCAHIETLDADRIVITHGTDTMTHTAEFLARELTPGRVVVLTGAMQPASMAVSDAAFNLGAAVAWAQALSPGVYVAMSGRCFPAGEVVKDRSRGVFVARS
jgi:L-asparaginase